MEAYLNPFFLIMPVLILGLVIYDWRTRRIPNLVVAPMLLFGLLVTLKEPGNLLLRLSLPLVLYGLWQTGGIGGGDVKMWTALWLSTPGEDLLYGLLIAVPSFVLGGAFTLWRFGKGRAVPSAWYALPYAIFLAWAGVS